MSTEVKHFRVTYNDIHNLIRTATPTIAEFNPDLLVAIGVLNLLHLSSNANVNINSLNLGGG